MGSGEWNRNRKMAWGRESGIRTGEWHGDGRVE